MQAALQTAMDEHLAAEAGRVGGCESRSGGNEVAQFGVLADLAHLGPGAATFGPAVGVEGLVGEAA
ncbi:hypothetical protein, partial [Streptomyces sp. NPDC001068]|uniref:hypothetical protein n=1 Tax=Streptomyces sp. NPDC001068 TaxID=3364544 RepID=UPI0036AD968B